MQWRRPWLANGLSMGLFLGLGPTVVPAQQPLQQLEQSVQQLPPPAAPAVEPGYLGIMADDQANPARGVQLTEILPGGPAAAAGLLPGDYITSIDGRNAATLDEMAQVLSARPAGDRVTFVILRGQEVRRIDVTLGKRPPPEERKHGNFGRVNDPNAPKVVAAPTPAPPPVDPKMIPPAPPTTTPPPGPRVIPHPGDYATPNLGPQPSPPTVAALPAPPPPTDPATASEPPPLLGVRAVPITPEMQVSLNLPEPRGALVVEVRPNSPAHRVGLPLEAVIVALDGKRIDSPAQLSDALQARGLGASVRISYFRYGQLSERTIKLGEGGPPPVVVAPPVDPLTPPPANFAGQGPLIAPAPEAAAPAAPKNAIPAPPEPALPPNVIAPTAPSQNGPANTPAIATPVPSKPETEAEALRRRVEELEAKLAAAEAKLRAEKEKANDEKPKKP